MGQPSLALLSHHQKLNDIIWRILIRTLVAASVEVQARGKGN